MSIFYFTASDKDAKRHLADTIVSPFPIGRCIDLLDEDTKSLLKLNDKLDFVHMWGAVPGKGNINRWENLKIGDTVLVYSEGYFIYSAKVIGKTINKKLAGEAWGFNKGGDTWEYIYFLDLVTPINVYKEVFSEFFGYKLNFTPQGFNRVKDDILEKILLEFSSIDEIIYYLDNGKKYFETIRSLSNERTTEDAEELNFENMSDEAFNQYLNTLDNSADVTIKEGIKKIRKYNLKLINELKKGYNHQCQICGSSCWEDYGVSICEAHHIEKFSITQNNNPNNIIILCPNHHRLLHKMDACWNAKTKQFLFKNGSSLKLQINKHL